MNLHLDAPATWGKTKHADMQRYGRHPSQESFFTKKVEANVNPVDLMTKPSPRSKIEHLMKFMGYRFVEQYKEQAGLQCARPACSQRLMVRNSLLKCLNSRQTVAQGRVLTHNAQTGIVDDSKDFLFFPSVLWCPDFLGAPSDLRWSFCDRLRCLKFHHLLTLCRPSRSV